MLKKEDKTSDDYLTLAEESLKKDSGNHKAALDWVEQSIELKETFPNKMFKAELLIKMGDQKKRGKALQEEALAMAKGFDMYYYGLSQYLLKGNKKKAFQLLKENEKQHPEDWIAHLALGEYYIKEGEQDKVIAHFKKAYKYAPDNWRNYARYLYLSNKVASGS